MEIIIIRIWVGRSGNEYLKGKIRKHWRAGGGRIEGFKKDFLLVFSPEMPLLFRLYFKFKCGPSKLDVDINGGWGKRTFSRTWKFATLKLKLPSNKNGLFAPSTLAKIVILSSGKNLPTARKS